MQFRKSLNQSFTEKEAAKIMNKVLYTLYYLHTKERIVHRYINSESIGFKKMGQISWILVYNFGCSMRIQSEDLLKMDEGDEYEDGLFDLEEDMQKAIRESY